MLRWMLGNTPWPEYTNAMMPNTSGSAPQLAAAVAAPAGKLPAQAHEGCYKQCRLLATAGMAACRGAGWHCSRLSLTGAPRMPLQPGQHEHKRAVFCAQ